MPGKSIVIFMAPADIRKEGSAYDLTLAVGIMAASGQIQPSAVEDYIIMGELSLDGSLQPIKGALPIAIKAREEGFRGFILPKQNAREAAVVNNLEVYGVENIREVVDFLNGDAQLEPTVVKCETCHGDCRCRRSQHYNDWPSGSRKDDAGQASAINSASIHAA